MSSTLAEPPSRSSSVECPVPAEMIVLEDRVPPSLKRSRRLAGCVVAFGAIFVWFVLQPLWHTDLWGHLSYGRWLVQHRAVPDVEPLLTLSQGMRFVDTAWLSQLIGYVTYEKLGVAGLQALLAAAVTLTSLLMYHRLFERTRRDSFAWLGVGLFLWLDWGLLPVIRPQLAGLLCFAVVLHRLTSRRFRSWELLTIPLLIAVWANLHGSFVVGLATIAVAFGGRAFDVLRRTGSVSSVWHDRRSCLLLMLLQLSVAAALLNPYGMRIYAEVLSISQNPNLQALTEWHPLDFRAVHGQVFAVSMVLLAILYRVTPRRVAAWEPLILFGTAAATLLSARFALWWGPLAAYFITLHLHASVRRWVPWRAQAAASPVSGKWSVVSLGLVWIFFAYSPLGMKILHGKDPDLAKATIDKTPLEITNWLNEHPPQGLIFNPYEWGDYLQWAGPTEMQVFLNSHVHLLPREVWRHYLGITQQEAGWSGTLDRYGVNTVVLDKEFRELMIQRMKENPAWKLAYEDNKGAIFQRRRPI